ncbi:uncharacterized protein BXZ73DRAFT_82094 [Epithele typhae]|uniref:uncharacterized protein n=1 Tax=Epithele typhae TaxID=378194 RepID=UPI002007C316|nr:uncharacterized protein BXZ73DRAFT_82094 [Epithele typhae]KAH9912919.1 hypothetical protein BXZ73DRAFT_82094 [Epithele typhae]
MNHGVHEEAEDKGTRDVPEFVNIFKDDTHAWPAVARRMYPSAVNAPMESIVTPFVKNSLAISNHLIGVLTDTLGLPAGSLASLHKVEGFSGCTARFIRAPSYPGPEAKTLLTVHIDFGSLSSVAQPLPGYAICNISDALDIFSGGILPPPREQAQYHPPERRRRRAACTVRGERAHLCGSRQRTTEEVHPGVTVMEWAIEEGQVAADDKIQAGGKTTEFLNVAAEDALVSYGRAPYAYPAPVNVRMGDAVGPFVRRAIEVNGTMLAILNEKLRLPRTAWMHRKEEWSGSEVRVTRSRPRGPSEGTDEAKATLIAHTYFGNLSFLRDCFGGLPARGRGGMARPPPGEQLALYERYSLVYSTRPGNSVQMAALADQRAIIGDTVAHIAPNLREIFDLAWTSHEWLTRQMKSMPINNQKHSVALSRRRLMSSSFSREPLHSTIGMT